METTIKKEGHPLLGAVGDGRGASGLVSAHFNRAGSISGMPSPYGMLIKALADSQTFNLYAEYGADNKITYIHCWDSSTPNSMTKVTLT